MEDTVCRFLSGKNTVNLVPQYFVYERHGCQFNSQKRSAYALQLVSEGEGCLILGEKRFALQSGDVFVTYPEQAFRLEGESLRYYYITFFGTAVSDTLRAAGIARTAPVKHGLAHLLRFWDKALSECHSENLYFLTNSVLMYTFSCLIPPSKQETPPDKGIVTLILRYAEEHYSNPKLSLSDICEQNFYNPRYVSSLFKKEVGVPFSKYLSSLRVNRARGFLENGSRSIKEAAYFSGFSDPFYFSKVFKAETGITPTEYLRQAASGWNAGGEEREK